MRQFQSSGHGCSNRIASLDTSDGPNHVVTEDSSEIRIVRKLCVIRGLYEARYEPVPQIIIRSHPGVDPQHVGLSLGNAAAVPRRPSKDLSPVPRQSLHVVRMAGVGKWVIEHRIVETSLVMSGGKTQKRRLTTCELKD
jgi:hypothetical protein